MAVLSRQANPRDRGQCGIVAINLSGRQQMSSTAPSIEFSMGQSDKPPICKRVNEKKNVLKTSMYSIVIEIKNGIAIVTESPLYLSKQNRYGFYFA